MANPSKVTLPDTAETSSQPLDEVTQDLVAAVARKVKGAYRLNGKEVRIKGTRFIPSTIVELGKGKYQVMANTVVEVSGQGGRPNRSEAVESVVTVGRKKAGQVLDGVKIPAFERYALR